MALPASANPAPVVAVVLALSLTISSAAQPAAPAATQAPLRPGSAINGARLFNGTARFANGGPPCVSCHTAAGIPFPNGGTLGPDLTGASTRFGPEGMQIILATLFFPTMNPVFQGRLLTPAEQADLLAFFDRSSQTAAAPDFRWIVAAAGGVTAVLLFLLTALIWRRRLGGVRHRLVARTIGEPQP